MSAPPLVGKMMTTSIAHQNYLCLSVFICGQKSILEPNFWYNCRSAVVY
ncbi:MAG: hypothetical protein KME17_03160 [Cyanosarcina radialis HA8281-LM2]|nr:hypothetical protein [Cyanosarcina radialis HA8281-LM2]